MAGTDVATVRAGSHPGARARASALLGAAGRSGGVVATLLLVVGAAALAGSAVIHLHLWSSGYRHIPTIGPLFLLQAIVGIVLAATVVAARRVWAGLVGAGFAVATAAGFLLSVSVGLFGFADTWAAPFAGLAFAVEIAAAVLLVAGAGLCLRHGRRSAGRPVSGRPGGA